MNAEILLKIKTECEKVESSTGHGIVTVKIKNGSTYLIEATCQTLIDSKIKK